jgi:hypothetical protein
MDREPGMAAAAEVVMRANAWREGRDGGVTNLQAEGLA